MERKWWKEAFGYQIYIRSFKDSNGDGIGDLRGIIEKLDYIASLGVNLIWICPFYESPMDDNGYDVADFLKVAKEYGTNEDAFALIQKAHQLGIKVILDLILNHTSDEHQWFIESRKSLDNPYRNYYIWKKGKVVDGKLKEPTNWASFFGGSCWQYDEKTNEFYMKIFSKKMPDLNWENPKVVEEMAKVANWWIIHGVDGFRIDAVSHLAKSDFIDSDQYENELYKPEWEKFSNQPKVHTYLKELNRSVFSKYDIVTVGEVGGRVAVEKAIDFITPENQELNMVFNFDHNWCNNSWEIDDRNKLITDIKRLKDIFNKWQKGLFSHGWNALYWLNHDHPRVVTHYGDTDKYHRESAKMLSVVMYFMWGTPFIYNGEEIGMTSPDFKTIDDFRDISTINQYHINVGFHQQDPNDFIKRASMTCRDNARTLMQWSDEVYGGFSQTKPWNIIGDYHKINVKNQIDDPDSILNFYKKVISLRLKSEYKDVIIYGDYQQVFYDHLQVYAYIRRYDNKKILVMANLTKEIASIENFQYNVKKIILSNYQKDKFTNQLAAFEAVVVEIEEEM